MPPRSKSPLSSPLPPPCHYHRNKKKRSRLATRGSCVTAVDVVSRLIVVLAAFCFGSTTMDQHQQCQFQQQHAFPMLADAAATTSTTPRSTTDSLPVTSSISARTTSTRGAKSRTTIEVVDPSVDPLPPPCFRSVDELQMAIDDYYASRLFDDEEYDGDDNGDGNESTKDKNGFEMGPSRYVRNGDIESWCVSNLVTSLYRNVGDSGSDSANDATAFLIDDLDFSAMEELEEQYAADGVNITGTSSNVTSATAERLVQQWGRPCDCSTGTNTGAGDESSGSDHDPFKNDESDQHDLFDDLSSASFNEEEEENEHGGSFYDLTENNNVGNESVNKQLPSDAVVSEEEFEIEIKETQQEDEEEREEELEQITSLFGGTKPPSQVEEESNVVEESMAGIDGSQDDIGTTEQKIAYDSIAYDFSTEGSSSTVSGGDVMSTSLSASASPSSSSTSSNVEIFLRVIPIKLLACLFMVFLLVAVRYFLTDRRYRSYEGIDPSEQAEIAKIAEFELLHMAMADA